MTTKNGGESPSDVLRALEAELGRGIVGQTDLIRGLLVGMLADGHILVEGVPGLGKTRAVNLLARICHLAFRRLQFTPDLLPADILGTRIFNQSSGTFETVKGPIFANFVLADEINRAPAKVQSALLETMQERQVTIGQESLELPAPFLVFATQNPIEQEGTYPLPEAQLDRFLMKLVVGYPEADEEERIVRMVIDERRLPKAQRRLSEQDVLDLQGAAQGVFVEDRVIQYASRLVQASRLTGESEDGRDLARYVAFGASPRGSISLVQAARAHALIEGRDAAVPHDVKSVAPAVLRHRILTTYYADAEGITSDQVVEEILATVKVP
ncbi:MAG: MoxR family ATPase [Acidobacteriota bacterium]